MNTILKKTILLIALIISFNVIGESFEGITISQNPVKIHQRSGEHPRPSGKNKGKMIRSTRMNINAQKQGYCIVYARYPELDENGKKVIDDHCGIGLWEPTICNWDCYDFIKIIINDKNLLLENNAIWKTGNLKNGNGFIDFIWDTKEAEIKMSFSMMPEDDKLFLTCSINPKTEINSIKVILKNSPSYITNMNKLGKRWIVSNSKDEEDSSKRKKYFTLDLTQDYWIFFADKVFDVALNNKAKGPSGLMFIPEETTKVKIKLISDLVNTVTMIYPPNTAKFHLVFWEFPGMTNKDALDYMKMQVAKENE